MSSSSVQAMADLNTSITSLNANIRQMVSEQSQANDANPSYFNTRDVAGVTNAPITSRLGNFANQLSPPPNMGSPMGPILDLTEKTSAVIGKLPLIGGAIDGVVRAFTGSIGIVHTWTEAIVASREGLRNFSSGMASAFAMSDVRDIQRNIRESSMTSSSTRGLLESRADLHDAMLPMKAASTNMLNNVAAGLNAAMMGLVPYLEKILDAIPGVDMDAIKKAMKEDSDAGRTNVGNFMKHIMDDVKKRRVNRRPGYRR